MIDRIRTGLLALYARRIKNWRTLENASAIEWLKKIGGEKAFKVIWEPLLKGKFGAEAENVAAVWFWNKLKLRGSSRKRGGRESLAYFDGGFFALSEIIKENLEKLGVELCLNLQASKIHSFEDGVIIETNQSKIKAEQALVTTPIPIFKEIASKLPLSYIDQISKIRYLGNVCLILELKQSLSKTYWLNVADPSFPFVGLIEHTNMDDYKNYGGSRIAYLSKYVAVEDRLFQMSSEEFFDYSLPYLQKIFPAFSKDWVISSSVWRAEHSQPIITRGYSKIIPDYRTPDPKIWLATMAQIYPEDRGTNYAVREGRKVARLMLGNLNK